MNLFKSKLPKPSELVKSARENLQIVEKSGQNTKPADKAVEEITKALAGIKYTIYGDLEHEPTPDAINALANEIYSTDLLVLLIGNLSKLEFEARKDAVSVFNNLLRKQVGSRSPTVEYICRNTVILDTLCMPYEIADVAMGCGSMLRECARHESLTKLVINSPNIWKFFKHVDQANFDVASDAFSSFKELLTKHKPIVAEFLEKNYDQFFEQYTILLNSTNYVTRRQSLKLLGELLLDRANFNIMTRYISDQPNLKLMMMLLRDKYRNIQFEAFHVFKVFVANPNKPTPILNVLVKNKDKLIAFLTNFHNDKEDDQFNDEKAFLLKQIQQLPSATK